MKPEEYFDLEAFETPHGNGHRLRLKGHRIDIDDVLSYVHRGYSPEKIATDVFPSLDVEKVRACIDYYREHKEQVDEYIAQSERIGEAYYQEYLKQPHPLRDRILALKAEREKNGGSSTANYRGLALSLERIASKPLKETRS